MGQLNVFSFTVTLFTLPFTHAYITLGTVARFVPRTPFPTNTISNRVLWP